ncbi:MAG: HD domain-containing protein, partial [Actinomycetota bacterium]|nr:HD domain-containing protein [Actinomycetota bacterium]
AGALRAAAAVASLAISAADASEAAARQAAQGSVVQLASEAMGTVLDENRLYRTVLVLTLELLDSSAGTVFVENDGAVSIEFEDQEEKLQALRRVALPERKPWTGRVGNGHALGTRIGRSGGAIFLFRESKPYSVADGVSIKLVARQLAYARERARLHTALEQTTVEAILALSAALESRDRTTGDHIERTQLLAERVAVGLRLTPDEVRATRYTAILHDVGKIGIPDSILNNPGKLNEDEWEIMKLHCAIGANILSKIAGFKQASEAVLAHHERFDGRGYPAGIGGANIPIEARIVAVVDAYDAMTHDRPYRKATSHDEAMKQLDLHSGTQFDPEVVEVIKAVLDEKEVNKP